MRIVAMLLIVLLAGCSEDQQDQHSEPLTPTDPDAFETSTMRYEGTLGPAVATPAGRAGSSLVGDLVIPANATAAYFQLNFTAQVNHAQLRLALCDGPCTQGDGNAYCVYSRPASFSFAHPLEGPTSFRIMVAQGATYAQDVTLDVLYVEDAVETCA